MGKIKIISIFKLPAILSLLFFLVITLHPPEVSAGICSTSITGRTLTITSSGVGSLTTGDTYNVEIRVGGATGPVEMNSDFVMTEDSRLVPIDLNPLVRVPDTRYFYRVTETGALLAFGCSGFFNVLGTGSNPTEGQNPCPLQDPNDFASKRVCNTAIGFLSSEASALVMQIMQIGTMIAGGIALIFMVIGSVRVLTSSGDQQKLNGGRDMIVAALAGLLFIIFSVLILGFAGIEIVGIPGFGRSSGP